MPSRLYAALLAAPLAFVPAAPAHAVATSCAYSNSLSGISAVSCQYLALSPVGSLTQSGPVQVDVLCTAGGTSGPGLFVQVGECSVFAVFSGPGSFQVGGVPV